MAQIFNEQPKSGKARKLWDWFTKHYDTSPDLLIVARPGRHQAAGGAFPYVIQCKSLAGGYDFAVYDPDAVLKSTPPSQDDINSAIFLHGYIDLG